MGNGIVQYFSVLTFCRHLGDTIWEHTPLYRGFKTAFGLFGGSGDHYTHNYESQIAFDLWDDLTPRFDLSCWNSSCPDEFYSTKIITEKSIEVIRAASQSQEPLYLQIAYTAPHLPYQAPEYATNSFQDRIENPIRRTYAGMIKLLDEGIRNITIALKESGMYEETLIVFFSDNGGMVDMDLIETRGGMGSNWPLRGSKRTLFEGGVRVPAFMCGAGILSDRRGTILSSLFHVSDWFPTLLTLAARQINPLWSWKDIIFYDDNEPSLEFGDGIDQWSYLIGETNTTARDEIILETHPYGSRSGNGNALIVGDWKILLRTAALWPAATNIGSNDAWFGGPNSSDPVIGAYALPIGATTQPYTVTCPSPPSDYTSNYSCINKPGTQLDDILYACVFNLADDPCEQVDLSVSRPDVLEQLWNRLDFYRNSVYQTKCTRCTSGLKCPSHYYYQECSTNWKAGSNNCKVMMPC